MYWCRMMCFFQSESEWVVFYIVGFMKLNKQCHIEKERENKRKKDNKRDIEKESQREREREREKDIQTENEGQVE